MHLQFKLPPLPPYPVQNDPPHISVKRSDSLACNADADQLAVYTPTTPKVAAERTRPNRAQPEPPSAPRVAPIKTHRWPSMNLHELEDLRDFSQSPTTVANMLVPDAPQRPPLPSLPYANNGLLLTAAHIVASSLSNFPWVACTIEQATPTVQAKPQAGSKRQLSAKGQNGPVTKRGKVNADGQSAYSRYRRRIDALLETATPQMAEQAKLIAEKRVQESTDPSKVAKRRYRFKRSALLKMVRQMPQRAPTPPPREAPRTPILPAGTAEFFTQAARSLNTESLPPSY